MKYRAHYIITSVRAERRNDEYRNDLYSNRILNVGDIIILDGLEWIVDEIVSDADREV